MQKPIVKQTMLFRVPADKVFDAFVNREVTTKFWFTHSDGNLEKGATVIWEWRCFGVSTTVNVVELEPCKKIAIEWGEPNQRTQVVWTFESRDDGSTLVTITNDGFRGDDDQIVAEAIDSMGGFSLVLANAKALLEHDLDLRLMIDHAPDAVVSR